MVKKNAVNQSDVVTTITSVTFLSLTAVLIVFFKNKSINDSFIYTLMVIAICLLSFTAIKSYIDISIASYKGVREVLNIKLFAYFGGLVLVGLSMIRSLLV